MRNLYTHLCITSLLINTIFTWREVSKCTTAFENRNDMNEFREPNTLDLECGGDLIFIAWSHYGNRRPNRQQQTRNSFLNNINDPAVTSQENCYFSPKDCMVNVDYVANECNGMSSCRISLDSQYLHSCKAYSNYLFIVYQCIEKKSAVDMCNTDRILDTNNLTDSTMYIHTPNYPIEYSNNEDCKCSMKTSGDSHIELLEFDLESSFIEDPAMIHQASAKTCTKDYLMIGNDTRICSTLSPFTNVIKSRYTKENEIIDFNFHSDDALTRRGFWIKIKPSMVHNCPADFVLIENRCIRVYNKPLTWYEAHNYCHGMGYSLAMIDNFELDKQLNNALFNEQGEIITHTYEVNNRNKNFWTGLKHLNETTWFDYKNEPIQFRSDEQNWWPWLVVDSSTYSMGSCVAKRADWLFLEDCYKRMPFVCEHNQKPIVKSSSVQLKCGADSNQYFQSLTTTTITTTTKPIKTQASSTLETIRLLSSSSIKSQKFSVDNIKTLTHADEVQLSYDKVKQSLIDSDSTVLIAVVCSVTVLIAFVNTIVVLYVCKRRKFNNQHSDSDKSSKTSQDTISSGHNINFEDITGAGTNSSSSLTFNPASNLFFPIDNTQSSRNTLFFTSTNPNRMQVGASANNTILTTLNSAKKSLIKKQAQSNPRNMMNPQDPLSHIYETISVTSASNCNMNTQNRNNHYNLLNYYHLHQNNNQTNNYNDIECDIDHMNANYNDLSLTDSSGSHKSHDYFINTKKSLKKNGQNPWQINGTMNHQDKNMTNKYLQSNHHLQFDRNTNRFSDLNMSSTNTSQSPSSTTTTITDYINPHTGQIMLAPHQGDFNSKPQYLINQSAMSGSTFQQSYNTDVNHHNSSASAFSKIDGSSFKCLSNGISQNNMIKPNNHPQQQHHNLISNSENSNNIQNVPFNFLSNQIEAVV